MGDKLRVEMEGVKGMKDFTVHFNVHTSLQIVFWKNCEKFRSPFKNETLPRRGPEIGKKY